VGNVRHWTRIVLCGLVAGVAWFLLSALSLSLVGQDLVAVVQRGGSYPRWGDASLFALAVLAAENS
jgi:hypothetical protein